MTPRISDLQAATAAGVDVPIPAAAPVNITAIVARKKVNLFVKMEISSLLRAEAPVLIGGERLCWSVPVAIGFPDRGMVGTVGEIQVDSMTGELLADAETVRRIKENATRLAISTSP